MNNVHSTSGKGKDHFDSENAISSPLRVNQKTSVDSQFSSEEDEMTTNHPHKFD